MNKVWDFKSINMGRELEIAGEFIYDSAKKAASLSGLNNSYEINSILYAGAVGIERLQKIYLCIAAQDPTDASSMPKCLRKHNHVELQKEIAKYTELEIPKNAAGLLSMFSDYYNNYRYANYTPGMHVDDLRALYTRFLKKIDGKFDFDIPCAAAQFEVFKRFYVNELGKVAEYYYKLIYEKAHELNIFTYEVDAFSKAARVFWIIQSDKLYDRIILERDSIKELLLYIYEGNKNSGVFQLFNDLKALDFDDALINEYLGAVCSGEFCQSLIDDVESMYEDFEDERELKERKELLSLIGDSSVLFDFEEDIDCDDTIDV